MKFTTEAIECRSTGLIQAAWIEAQNKFNETFGQNAHYSWSVYEKQRKKKRTAPK